MRIKISLLKKQREKLHKLKSERDSSTVKSKLKQIENAANGNENLVPVIFDAVKSYATLGEISDTLRSVFGQYRESVVF